MRRIACLKLYIGFVLVAVLCMGGMAPADWDAGDPALYYQLPDESDGWSVYVDEGGAEPLMAADDWTAATTAQITDIYFWGGWRGDAVGQTGDIQIKIFNNDASMPGDCVWSRVFTQGQYTARLYRELTQNYYDPREADKWGTDDHDYLFQYSVPMITNTFTAQAGQTYWLTISPAVQGGIWGWNTTGGVSGGPAVFWDENNAQWAQLMTPDGYVPLDMAFVLAPEPATLLLIGLGVPLLSGLRKRKI